jgi:ABC-type Fe3+-hydroxamate transport system substrate-binding protein
MKFIDDLGLELHIKSYPPKRIISVVPSLTELLYDLDLADEIVGITKFCVFPEVIFRSKTRIGGTKKLNIEKIKALQPDLIIANKEENQKEDIEYLSSIFPTYVTDIRIMDDAIGKIQTIGDLTDRKRQAQRLVKDINTGFEALDTFRTKPKVAYMIWKDPIMVAGGDTYISNMLEKAGFENVFADQKRYPSITPTMLKAADAEFIFLSSEPFPFKSKDISYFESLTSDATATLVDGTMFSWYGSRLKQVPSYLLNLRQELKLKI